MVTTFSRTFVQSAIVLATVVILTPSTTGFSAPGGAQVPGGMPPSDQVIAIIMEDHVASLAFQQSVANYVKHAPAPRGSAANATSVDGHAHRAGGDG